MRISLVTPLYRSAPGLRELCDRARATIRTLTPDYEIVLVNDGSPDDSLAIARDIAAQDPNVVVIDLSRNFGQHPALMTGLRAATGDYVFICDSDLEEDPEWIADFHVRMQEEDCDVVYGVQTARKGGAFYRLARGIFYRTLNLASGIAFPANIITARLMTRRYVDAVAAFPERELFAAGIWHMAGFRQIAFEVAKPPRSQTTYTFSKLAGVFVNAVTAFSVRPLQAISIVGVALSMLAVLFIAYLVYQRLVVGNVLEGWTSVIATTLLIGGIILFFNGVMAIYLAKIFLEVKQRPLTIVREVVNPRSSSEAVARQELNSRSSSPQGGSATQDSRPQAARSAIGLNQDSRPQVASTASDRASQDSYKTIIAHYERCLQEHGTGPRAVDWKDEHGATTRYDVMLDLLRTETEPVTLLDFGCGLGDLKHHIDARGLDHVHYVGLDVSPAYAEAARAALPGTTIHCMDVLQDDSALPDYDYIVMNGIFTRRQDLGHADMLAYLERLGSAVFAHARRGLAFNVMSAHVDWKSEDLFHPEVSELAGVVARAMSRHMVLRDDYGLYECTCYVYRDPAAGKGTA